MSNGFVVFSAAQWWSFSSAAADLSQTAAVIVQQISQLSNSLLSHGRKEILSFTQGLCDARENDFPCPTLLIRKLLLIALSHGTWKSCHHKEKFLELGRKDAGIDFVSHAAARAESLWRRRRKHWADLKHAFILLCGKILFVFTQMRTKLGNYTQRKILRFKTISYKDWLF